jgi:hypothetical protein
VPVGRSAHGSSAERIAAVVQFEGAEIVAEKYGITRAEVR